MDIWILSSFSAVNAAVNIHVLCTEVLNLVFTLYFWVYYISWSGIAESCCDSMFNILRTVTFNNTYARTFSTLVHFLILIL